MANVHVFNAGPCLLPQQAIDSSIEALKNFKNTGISVLSVSHRSKEWGEVMDEVRANWKELLHIPDTHEVIFLGGGANLLRRQIEASGKVGQVTFVEDINANAKGYAYLYRLQHGER